MGLFTRRREQATGADAIWQSAYEDYEILSGTQADMDDDSQATLAAYRVDYLLDTAPGSAISFWTYVLHGPRPDTYQIGIRYQHFTADDESEPGYDLTGDGPLIYDLEDADASAVALAQMLTAGGADVRWDFAEIFAWDGRDL